jgi:hypothetical protein
MPQIGVVLITHLMDEELATDRVAVLANGEGREILLSAFPFGAGHVERQARRGVNR